MSLLRSLGMLTLFLAAASLARADEPLSEYEQAKQRIAGGKHDLRYKFTAGETARWEVTHLATVDTKIKGNLQTSKSRSVSTRAWRVEEVDAEGRVTFTNTIEKLVMWSQVSGQEEVKYNSETDPSPPPLYVEAAKTIGKPLATLTIDSRGEILSRESELPAADLGFGGAVLALPAEPIAVGGEWLVPRAVRVRLRNGQVRTINTQQRHKLLKVQTGVATISVRTEVLTPVNDPEVQSQLVQRLTHGEVKFDLDAGRVLSRQMDLDETVVGFNGADSIMTYLARYTEQLLPPPTASLPAKPSAATNPAPAVKPESEPEASPTAEQPAEEPPAPPAPQSPAPAAEPSAPNAGGEESEGPLLEAPPAPESEGEEDAAPSESNADS